MSAPTTQFYNPLDQSQIEFIPSDTESLKESKTTAAADSLDVKSTKESIEERSLSSREPTLSLRRGSTTMSELITSSLKRTQSFESQTVDAYVLSRMSTSTSLTSNVIDRVRYKIVLRLNSRERTLLRESWAMILNEDPGNLSSKIALSTKKGLQQTKANALDPQRMRSRRGSTASLNSCRSTTNVVPETKGNIHSNAFASSLFCSQFYANLLTMDPELERMFPSTRHQAVAFAGVLTTAIKHLENLQALENFLEGLGKRHARILNIEPPHFEEMGVAFLKTLQDRFGVHCTIELEEVWSRLYSYLANSILQFGVDPYLQVDLNQDTLVFPVPNVQTGSSRTVSRLSSRISLSESLKTGNFPFSKESHSDDPKDRKSSSRTNAPSAKKVASRSKNQSSKTKEKKGSKLTFSSNQDCVVM